ncbi:UDP-N-acetylmuramoyl-tripeptide--D-alanyl-D-alanine ligase [Candidatus Poribacteria bacterium]|nr:UDP-N-acetylmuramoyl-tripeptide--D-alanyl-D-alanine ligase [Candidatus Poribacteria bacterium]
MDNFKINDILNATNGKLLKGNPDFRVAGISTDSRTLNKDDLFIALIGEKFDGHNFVNQAASQGAMGLIVSRDVEEPGIKNLIFVDDTLKALGDIARLYRSGFNIPVIGISGSNGKTTTKDMAAAILSKKYRVLKNEGNLNNIIGVSMTLFKLTKAHEAAVIEMGISIPGEMARLTEVVRPDVAVMTNVSATHLEFLGSIDNVAFEKGILVKSAHRAVLNADDPRVAMMREPVPDKVIFYGLSKGDVLAEDISQDSDGKLEFTLVTSKGRIKIHLPILGKHNVYNALAAASVGVFFSIELNEIKEALESFVGMSMRMQKVTLKGITIIDDTYNSNPVSLKSAINYISDIECDGKKIAVIGDMLELGEKSEDLHKESGRFIASCNIDMLITVGNMASKFGDGALEAGFPKSRLKTCGTNPEAFDILWDILKDGDRVLIKGSRGMKMDEIVRGLEHKLRI